MVSGINDILSSVAWDVVVVYFGNLCFLNFQVPECCLDFLTVCPKPFLLRVIHVGLGQLDLHKFIQGGINHALCA